jgi:hypothetical protein
LVGIWAGAWKGHSNVLIFFPSYFAQKFIKICHDNRTLSTNLSCTPQGWIPEDINCD